MRFKNTALYFLAILFFAFSYRVAYAVTINFDDIDPNDLEQLQLRNEYAALGVIFDNAYLVPSAVDHGNIVTGPGFYITFIGELPTYVSFITNNVDGLKNSAEAKGPNGYEEVIITEGWIRGTTHDDERNTPYVPNQRIVLRSEFGISSVRVSSQSSPEIDYLIFHNITKVVPEPSLAGLFILGLSGVFFRNRKFYCKK